MVQKNDMHLRHIIHKLFNIAQTAVPVKIRMEFILLNLVNYYLE